MFFLETKDGDRFFTDPKSDDKIEFEKIIESKMGRQASDLFDNLIFGAKSDNEKLLEQAARRLKECIEDMDSALDTELDRDRLAGILSDIQAIYNMIS